MLPRPRAPAPTSMADTTSTSSTPRIQKQSRRWTKEEEDLLLVGLEIVGKHEKDRWRKIADEFVVTRTANQVRSYAHKYFHHFSSNYSNPNFEIKNATPAARHSKPVPEHLGVRNNLGNDATRHERKTGGQWKEEEHELFLEGLNKYGSGKWKKIADEFVVTRTAVQVANHAYKYLHTPSPTPTSGTSTSTSNASMHKYCLE